MLAARFSLHGFDSAVVTRVGTDAMFDGCDALYVVGRGHDSLLLPEAHPTFVQPGLLVIKVGEGRRHPLIRAVCGNDTDDDLPESVLDLTTGLAGDALHVAEILTGTRVSACEGSVVLHALLEEGLPRLARDKTWGQAAARITLIPRALDHLEHLRSLATGSVDVVMLDPMMRRPLKSQPSFQGLRRFAVAEPPSTEVIDEARRVARRRVVYKHARDQRAPIDLEALGFGVGERGAHITYRVLDVVAAAGGA